MQQEFMFNETVSYGGSLDATSAKLVTGSAQHRWWRVSVIGSGTLYLAFGSAAPDAGEGIVVTSALLFEAWAATEADLYAITADSNVQYAISVGKH